MKQRFVRNKNNSLIRNIVISVVLFMLIFFCFSIGLLGVSKKADIQERQTLEAAINRQVVHCYVMEGSYPPSIQYLREHYGLTYDEKRFFVAYQIQGSNIMPDVTIIEKGDSK